jgi:hypothetical protein
VAKKYGSGQIGQPGPDQYGYVAGLQGAKLEIYAPDLASARRAALAFWSPFKKDLPYLWVLLAEKPGGEQVVQVVSF